MSNINPNAAIKAAVFENSLPSEVSSYVCALAAWHLPAAGRSSANATLAGFR